MTHGSIVRATVAAAIVVLAVIAILVAAERISVPPARPVADTYVLPATPTRAANAKPEFLLERITPVAAPAMAMAPLPSLPVGFAVGALGIDAPVVQLGLDGAGNLASPEGPDDAGWYAFTATPGSGGNAVFSGHLDWYSVGPAVFWRMNEASPGDDISVTLADGRVLTYTVAWARTYPVAETPMAMVLESTTLEAVTIITCAGAFIANDYTERLVIRAYLNAD